MYIFYNIVFLLFSLVTMLRILVAFNLFSNSISVLLPLIFIIAYILYFIISPIKTVRFNSISKERLLFYLIILSFIFIPTVQFFLFENMIDGVGRRSNNYIWTVSLLCISWFLVGYIMSQIKEVKAFHSLIVLLCTLVSLYLMSTSFIGSIFVDYYYLSSLRSDGIKMHHLLLTEPLTFIIFLFVSLFYNKKLKWLGLAIFLFIFFSLGGRTAFFCAILTLVIYELITSNALNYLSTFAFFAIITILVSANFDFSDNIFFNKLFFKDGLESDGSYNTRVRFFRDFFDGFLDQFAIGYPNFFIEKHNDLGTYSHNILSIFQFYGFIFFTTIIYTIYFIGKKIVRYKYYNSKNVLDTFGFLIFIYAVLSVITGKAVLFGPFWFALGFLLFRVKRLTKEETHVQ